MSGVNKNGRKWKKIYWYGFGYFGDSIKHFKHFQSKYVFKLRNF